MGFVIDKNSLNDVIGLQNKASDPNNSAWVFASAGSGKTKILVDRVLRLLLSGVDGNKILCVTFTNVAAIEMKKRINDVLAKWALLDEEKLRAEILSLGVKNVKKSEINLVRTLYAKVLDGDFEIKIQTIHAFCQNFVKVFPFEMGVSPNFKILDDKSEKILLEKAKRRVFSKSLTDENLKNAIEKISSKQSEESFFELLAKILGKKEQLTFLLLEFGSIENLIAKISSLFGVENFSSEEDIFQSFVSELNFSEAQNLANAMLESKSKKDAESLAFLRNFLQNPELRNIDNLSSLFLKKDGKLKLVKSIATKEFLEYYDFIADFQQKFTEFSDLLKSYRLVEINKYLLEFIYEILQQYSDLKKKDAVLDYNDLIIKTNELLDKSDIRDWVKLRLDGFFDHILIDESQDTNHRQWNIIKALSDDFFSGESARNGNRSLFIIGDDKQSIYSFQGAKPNISREIYDFYSQRTQDIKQLGLKSSFRSLKEILQFVDNVFKNNESFVTSGYQQHNPVRLGSGKVEVWPKALKDEEKQEFSDLATRHESDHKFCQKTEMANEIANKILNWVQSERKLDGYDYDKRVKFGDIMIMANSVKSEAMTILQNVFQEKSIPYRSLKRFKFSQNLIIQDLLAIMKFALLPKDDLNLACLLKSPFFKISEDELYQLCALKNEKEISLFESIALQKEKYLPHFAKLENILQISEQLSCYDFFSNLISSEIRQFYSEEFQDSADLIIDKFLLEVLNFNEEKSINLQKFLEYVDKIDPEISVMDGEEDSVLISTIHSAKGLQSPIVILPDCSFNFSQRSQVGKEKLFWFADSEKDDLKIPIWVPSAKDRNNFIENVKKEHEQEIKQEYWRLFYVAITRAENELYIAGFSDKEDEDSWYRVAKEALNLS